MTETVPSSRRRRIGGLSDPSSPTDVGRVSPFSGDSSHGRTAQFFNHTGVHKFCTVDRRHAAELFWVVR